jgi:hypothetical protein
MDPVLNKLNVPPKLAYDFMGVFARGEFALKAASFANGNEKHAEADWDGFAKAIANAFDPSKNQELNVAVEYLLKYPPKKQVFVNNKLEFADSPPDKNQSQVQQVLLMVRRVRNNLFHGSKFLPGPVSDPKRDTLLIQHSLTVLHACIPLHRNVYIAYTEP